MQIRAYFEEYNGTRSLRPESVSKKNWQDLDLPLEIRWQTSCSLHTNRVAARELFEALKIKKIYVRYFNKPRIDNYLRVTIGTDEEMDALLAFFRDYLKKKA